VTPGGEIARYLLGLDHSPAELRQALAAAGNGEIAPAAHPLFLLCFGYDPQPGTAGFVVLQALRLTGLAAVAACLLLILSALRRERKG
jgi:protein SCO1/2